MREKNRNSIEMEEMLPQFTTMNVIDGQAGLMSYSSLIFYSLTIDNILNIIVLLILAGVTIAMLMGDNGILTKATEAKDEQADGTVKEAIALLWNEYQLEIKSSSNEGVKESTKIASTEITKIQGEEVNYLATTATSFWDFLLTDKQVINANGIVDVQKLTGQKLDRGNGTDGVTDVYKIELDEETNAYTLKYCVKAGEEESIWNVTEEKNNNVKTLTIKDIRSIVGEDITIQYEEGMTWEDWLVSEYNVYGFETSNEVISYTYNSSSYAYAEIRDISQEYDAYILYDMIQEEHIDVFERPIN